MLLDHTPHFRKGLAVIRPSLLPSTLHLLRKSTSERIRIRQRIRGGRIVNEKGENGNRMSRVEERVATVVFSVLLSVPALVVYGKVVRGDHGGGISDADVWWHLRTAEWILAHEAWPTTDPFSHTSAVKSASTQVHSLAARDASLSRQTLPWNLEFLSYVNALRENTTTRFRCGVEWGLTWLE